MAKEDARWAKIKAAFEGGASVNKLAKEHGVSIADILRRAKAEGWRRGGAPKAEVAVIVPKSREEARKVAREEAAQDIIREHRERTRTHRDTYDKLQAEFQAMMGHLVSFLDEPQIAKIKAAAPADAIKLLVDMLKAMSIKFGMFERLSNMLATLIELERKVWGLNETDGAPESTAWDDLLAKVREPARQRVLPDNVVAFDRQMQQSKAP